MPSDSDKPLSSAQMKVWPGAKEADGLQKDLGTELRPPDDITLYALVLESHRMLKALTERLMPQTVAVDLGSGPDVSRVSVVEVRDVPPRPLTEPDMQHVLKTGSLPDDRSAPAGSAEWKLACRDAAARINEALGYQTQNPNLEESLAVLRNKAQFGVLAGSAAALVQSAIRDAALEAAASILGEIPIFPTPEVWGLIQEGQSRIRALKSKPAPQLSGISGGLGHAHVAVDLGSRPDRTVTQEWWKCAGCGESGTGKMPGRHEMRWCVQDAQKHAASPKPAGD